MNIYSLLLVLAFFIGGLISVNIVRVRKHNFDNALHNLRQGMFSLEILKKLSRSQTDELSMDIKNYYRSNLEDEPLDVGGYLLLFNNIRQLPIARQSLWYRLLQDVLCEIPTYDLQHLKHSLDLYPDHLNLVEKALEKKTKGH